MGEFDSEFISPWATSDLLVYVLAISTNELGKWNNLGNNLNQKFRESVFVGNGKS